MTAVYRTGLRLWCRKNEIPQCCFFPVFRCRRTIREDKEKKKTQSTGDDWRYALRLSVCFNPRTFTQSHTPTVVQEGGSITPLPLGFLICCNISKRFYLQWKAFDLLYKTRYILWGVALLKVSPNMAAILDFIKHYLSSGKNSEN